MVNLIPSYLIPKLAREAVIDKQARDWNPNSHVIALIHVSLDHGIGLKDICDILECTSAICPPFGGAQTAAAQGARQVSHALERAVILARLCDCGHGARQ